MQDTIRESLKSVLSQTLKDIEVICIDDGSTDDSAVILKELSSEEARIKVLYQSNKGSGAARNAGLDSAQGEYVCFLDADDYYPSDDTLEYLYNTAVTNNVNICGGSFSELNNGKLETNWKGLKGKYTFGYDGLTFYKNYQFDYGYQRFIYNRIFLNSNNIRFPDYRRFQDPPFFVKAMIAADKFYALKRPSYVYRVGGFSRVVWTKEKLMHMITGLRDLLILSSEHGLAELHEQTINRALTTYLSLLTKNKDFIPFLVENLKKFLFSINKGLAKNTDFSSPAFNSFLSFAEVSLSDFEKMEIDHRSNTEFINNTKLRKIGKLEKSKEICKENAPLVSVIIPVYNVENYIADCLSSVIDQTYDDLEILCIDDGSEDLSVSIAEKHQKNDERIKILHKENGGLSSARNYGIKHATGKYILFLDSDDYIEQNAVLRLVECAESSGADIVHFNARVFFEGDGLLEKHNEYSTYYVREKTYSGMYEKGKLFSDLMHNDEFKPSAWLHFLNSEFVKSKDVNFYEGIIHEDDLFSPLALISAEKVFYIEDALYVRRIREDSIVTRKKTAANIVGHFTSAVELARFRENTELSNDVSEALKKYICDKIRYSFYIFDELRHNGLELSVVKSALGTQKNSLLFEYLDSERKHIKKPSPKPLDDHQNDSERPAVTVVLPMENCTEIADDVLLQFVNQSFADFEVLCIITETTDDTKEIIKDFCKRDSRFRYTITENSDSADALKNKGLDMASGKYIVWANVADVCSEDYLQKLYHSAVSNDAQVTVCRFTQRDSVLQEDVVKGFDTKIFFENCTYSHRGIENLFVSFEQYLSNIMFSTVFLRKIGLRFIESGISSDLYFVYAGLSIADRISVVHDALVEHRINIKTGHVIYNSVYNMHESVEGLRNLYQWLKNHSLTDIHEEDYFELANKVLLDYGMLETTPRFVLEYARMLDTYEPWNDMAVYEILNYTGKVLFPENIIRKKEEIRTHLSPELIDSDRELALIYQKYNNLIHTTKLIRQISKERYGLDFSDTAFFQEGQPENDISHPLVTVIIPVYNVELYIEDCLYSVISQTYRNLEILCIDDGSEDHSVNIAEEFQKDDERIKILHKENGGLSSARNYGIKHAAGKYILFLDSDDCIEQGAVLRLVECAESTGSDIVHFNAKPMFESDDIKRRFRAYDNYYSREKTYPGLYKKGELFSCLIRNNEFKPSACLHLLRTEFVICKKIFFYEGILHEDNHFSALALLSAEKTFYITDALYIRRIREGSIVTKDRSAVNVAGLFTAAAELAIFRECKSLTDKNRKHLKRYILDIINYSFKIHEELKQSGFELDDVKSALKTTEDRILFELTDYVRS